MRCSENMPGRDDGASTRVVVEQRNRHKPAQPQSHLPGEGVWLRLLAGHNPGLLRRHLATRVWRLGRAAGSQAEREDETQSSQHVCKSRFDDSMKITFNLLNTR